MTDLKDTPGASSIKTIPFLAAVRKRPRMYIGDDSTKGLIYLVQEILISAINEAVTGRADLVTVTLNPDDSCTVKDNGGGIPIDLDPMTGVAFVESVFTELYARGKPDAPCCLLDFGAPVVNALSNWLKLKIRRDGKIYEMSFTNAVVNAPLSVTGSYEERHIPGTFEGRSGTEVTFLPATEIFSTARFDFDAIEHKLREFSSLCPNTRIVLTDRRHADVMQVELQQGTG